MYRMLEFMAHQSNLELSLGLLLLKTTFKYLLWSPVNVPQTTGTLGALPIDIVSVAQFVLCVIFCPPFAARIIPPSSNIIVLVVTAVDGPVIINVSKSRRIWHIALLSLQILALQGPVFDPEYSK